MSEAFETESSSRRRATAAALGGGFLGKLVRDRVARLESGQVLLREGSAEVRLGRAGSDLPTPTVTVRNARFWRRVALGGSLGVAESFRDGDFDCDDLVTLCRLFVRDVDRLDRLETGLSRFGIALSRLAHRFRRNDRRGSKRNIRDHYDLGNDFFQLFLDETLSYSCALFEKAEDDLLAASINKLDIVCRKLELGPEDHLVEIGTGWGGLAIHAARAYGCKVTTTTISEAQFELAGERISAAGLADRIDLRRVDYRDLDGRYDKLVSIEMIEAVGHENLPAYFARCDALLKPGGLALIQAITIPDHRQDRYLREVDFIQSMIFPGSSVPSMAAMEAAWTGSSRLSLRHRDDHAGDYARTLAHWRRRFRAAEDAVRGLGFDERFRRVWDFYLAYCEAGFAEGYSGLWQILLEKKGGAEA